MTKIDKILEEIKKHDKKHDIKCEKKCEKKHFSCVPICFEYDFTRQYSPSDFNCIVNDDGTECQDCTGLTICSCPFTSTVCSGQDDAKWLKYYKKCFKLCKCHEVITEAIIAAKQCIDLCKVPHKMVNRIRNIHEDIRLASSALSVFDPETWMVFNFYLTDTDIYAYYERLPFGRKKCFEECKEEHDFCHKECFFCHGKGCIKCCCKIKCHHMECHFCFGKGCDKCFCMVKCCHIKCQACYGKGCCKCCCKFIEKCCHRDCWNCHGRGCDKCCCKIRPCFPEGTVCFFCHGKGCEKCCCKIKSCCHRECTFCHGKGCDKCHFKICEKPSCDYFKCCPGCECQKHDCDKCYSKKYAAFSSAIWVSKRPGICSLDEFIVLGIGIHSGKGLVTWYVNGLAVFSWNRIGLRMHDEFKLLDLGGDEEIVQIKNIRVGFGNFSLLDKALPNNYARQFVTEVQTLCGIQKQIADSALVQLWPTCTYRELYKSFDGEERKLVKPSTTFTYVQDEICDSKKIKLFGQGAKLRIKKLKVYSR